MLKVNIVKDRKVAGEFGRPVKASETNIKITPDVIDKAIYLASLLLSGLLSVVLKQDLLLRK